MTTPDPQLQESEESPATKAALSLADMNVIAESTVGYHRTLVAGGIPVNTAASMAEAFHTTLLELARKSVGL